MADIRINALTTTATSSASDDFIAIDGSANGTRKLSIYNPTIGGNLTLNGTDKNILVSGASTQFSRAVDIRVAGDTEGRLLLRGGGSLLWGDGVGNYDSTLTRTSANLLTITGALATTGNLTVSGTSGNYLEAPNQNPPSLGSTGGTLRLLYQSQYGLLSGVAGTGNSWMQAQRVDGTGTAYNLLLQPSGGNLLLGTTTDQGFRLGINGASDKQLLLDVSAGGRYTSLYWANAGTIKAAAYWDNTVNGFQFGTNPAGSSLYLQSAGTTALTLDSSQNATFEKEITAKGTNGYGFLHSAAANKYRGLKLQTTGSDRWLFAANDTAESGSNAGSDLILFAYTDAGGFLRSTLKFTRSSGNLQLGAYGAGTLSTDASGNVTASSDARLKTNLRTFARGLADVIKLAPKTYNWNETSGMDTASDYVGFVAQDVQSAIPEAVYEGKDANKTLTLNDRAILAALVNAVRELNAKLA